MKDLVCPLYYRIAQREGNSWHFNKHSVFYNPSNVRISDPNDIQALYGISWESLAIEFFRINAGRQGWYLANLRDRKYYYCGLEPDSVKLKLRELGIGQEDPITDESESN